MSTRRDTCAHDRPPSVLVVEDEQDIRDLLVEILSLHGLEVSAAGDGLEALDVIAAITPDLLVVDWMMPRMDGLQLVREVRGQPTLEKVPVLIVSAYVGDGDGPHEPPVDGFLPKPFTIGELVDTVMAMLDRSGRAHRCAC